MAKKVYDAAVKVGTYEKDGKTKNKYENVGIIMENNDGGRFMLMNRTFNPAGVPNPENQEKVLISFFEPKEKASQESW